MSDIVPVRSTITANGGKVIVSTGGQAVVGIELEGTWVGTLHLQETVSGDGFVDAQVTNAANAPVSATVSANGKFFVAAAGRSAIQVIATAWTSGTATVIAIPTGGSAGGSSGGGGAVTAAVGAFADGADVTFGAQADAAATTDAGTFTFISLFKRLLQKFTTQLPAALTGSGNLKVSVAESTASQAITAASLPLPTGAATDTTVAGVTTAVNTLTTQSDFDTKVGSLTETAPATDTASSGANGRLQRIAQRLTSLIGLLPTALGSTTAANSLPVTLATDGQFVTSTGALTETAPATDTASSGLNGRLQRLAQRLTTLLPQNAGRLNVDGAGGTFPVTNSNLDAATSTLLTTSDFDTKAGSLTETAPATDTASSGLNGRLQRVAQRLTSLIALLPSALISNRLDVNIGAAPATVNVQGAQTAGAGVATNPLIAGVSDGTNAQFLKGDTSGRAMMVGAAANNAALAGNPVLIAGSDATNAVTLKTSTSNAGNLLVNGTTGAAPTDGITNASFFLNSGGGTTPAATLAYASNGASNDRIRNNVDVTLLASAARTTTQTGSNITAYNCQGIAVTLDVTAIVATCSLTVTIGYVDPASGKTVNLLTSAVIAAVSTTMLIVDPRVPAAANLIAQKPIGRTFVITVTVGNANSQTYSLGYTLIPC